MRSAFRRLLAKPLAFGNPSAPFLPSIRSRRLGQVKLFSRSSDEESINYIDQWFATIVKPEDFYEYHANDNPRRYFYNVDLQGRLFLEDTMPKNIATSIKDSRFLDFFFRRLRPVGSKELPLLQSTGISVEEYPYVSPCGNELNFVRPAATPIVFHTLDHAANGFLYAGSLSQPFQASSLAVSKLTGRLYHRCDHMEKALSEGKAARGELNHDPYALIRSAVVVSLSEQIHPIQEEDEAGHDNYESSGLAFHSTDQKQPHPIPFLPQNAEPGGWAMPFVEDCD